MQIMIELPDEPTIGDVIEAVFGGIKVEKCRGFVTIVTPYENLSLWNITWFRPYMPKGIVLPKGHGDLIDRNELKMFGSWQMQIIPEGNGKYVETKIYTQRAVDAMQTIIPADKGEENE